jgi:hypothetical protein
VHFPPEGLYFGTRRRSRRAKSKAPTFHLRLHRASKLSKCPEVGDSTSILFEILLAPAENSVLTRREIADRAGLSTNQIGGMFPHAHTNHTGKKNGGMEKATLVPAGRSHYIRRQRHVLHHRHHLRHLIAQSIPAINIGIFETRFRDPSYRTAFLPTVWVAFRSQLITLRPKCSICSKTPSR